MKKGILFVTMLLLISCSTVLLTGRRQFTAIPSSQMLSLSNDSYNEVLSNSKLSSNQTSIEMVRSVGYKISDAVEDYLLQNGQSDRIKNFNWEYNVIQSDQLNAWCMPGGKIAFYEGIMPVCQDKNGVAVVMAHEVAHAIARHGNERMSQQLAIQLGGMALAKALEEETETTKNIAMAAFGVGSQVGVMLPYSRTHEKEADELGLYFMAMAGFDPRGSVDFWQRMQEKSGGSPPEFLSTHPHANSRIRNLNQNMDKALEYYHQN